MKQRYLKLCALFLAIVLVVCSAPYVTVEAATTTAGGYGAEPTIYSKQYNSGTRDVWCTTLSGTSASSYYTGSYTYDNLSEQSASTIKSSLRTLMKSTHKKLTSYNDCHYKADRTDCENENGRVTLIYTSYSATMSQWNGWNREHVWPKSLGGKPLGKEESEGGSDLHHLRPSDSGVNSSRGNKPYGKAGSGASSKYGTDPAVGVLGGTYNSTYFEPLDNVKGDVARICLYVYVRWGSDWGADSITEVFQSVDVLLEWMEIDPVDTWEMGRNEVVQDIQGNRNVFIDYPEYAWMIYGREVPDDMVTPSGEAMSGNGGNSGTTTEKPTETPTEKPTETPTDAESESTEVPPVVDPGQEVTNTLSFADKAQRTEFTNEKQVWAQNGITVTNNKASSTTAVADYAGPARFYANSEITISAKDMKSITVECNSSSYANTLVTSLGSVSGVSVSANSSTVTINLENAADELTFTCSAQIRINSLTVTSVVSAETPTDGPDLPNETEEIETDPTIETESPTNAPVDTEVPTEETLEKVTEVPMETESPTNAPVDTEDPTETPTEAPTEETTENTTEVTTEPPEVDTEEKLENTLSFADKDQRTEFSADIQVWEQNGITFTNNKASSQSPIADSINPIRLYSGATVQIESENMSKIVFKCSSSTYAGNLAKSLKDLSGATVTTSGSDVTVVFERPTDEFTFTCSAHIRLNSLVVTSALVEDDGEDPTDPPSEETTEKVTEAPSEETTEKVTEAPSEETTEKVTEAPSEETTEKVTEAPSGETTEKVTEAPSEEITEKVTEAPSEETTEKVTEAPSEETTEKVTEAPTEETTEVSTDAPETPTDPNGSDESETEPDTSDDETEDGETEYDVTEQPSETEYPEQDPPEMPETKPETEPETELDYTKPETDIAETEKESENGTVNVTVSCGSSLAGGATMISVICVTVYAFVRRKKED